MSEIVKLDTRMSRAFTEMGILREMFAEYCGEHGYRDSADPCERLMDLAASFAFLVSHDGIRR